MTGAGAVDGAGFRLVLAGWLSSASSISLLLALAPFRRSLLLPTSMVRVKSKRYLQRFPLCECALLLLFSVFSIASCGLYLIFFLYLFSFTINCKIVARGFYSELFSVHSAHRFVVRFLISYFIIHYSMDMCVCVCLWWGKFIEPQKAATNYETQNSVNCQMFDGSGYLWLTDRERNMYAHTHVHLHTYRCTLVDGDLLMPRIGHCHRNEEKQQQTHID